MKAPELPPKVRGGLAVLSMAVAIGAGGVAVGEHIAAAEEHDLSVKLSKNQPQAAQELATVAEDREALALGEHVN